MAKSSVVEKNEKRKRMSRLGGVKRREIRKAARAAYNNGEDTSVIFGLYQQLNKMHRDTNPNRVRNRCRITGRPHGYYGRMEMSRIALRELGSKGFIPGLVKSSW